MGDYNDERRIAKIFAAENQRRQAFDLSVPVLLVSALFVKAYRPRARLYLAHIAVYVVTLTVLALLLGTIAWL